MLRSIFSTALWSRRRALARFAVSRLGRDADRTYRRVLGV